MSAPSQGQLSAPLPLDAKVEDAKRYLRERGKYVIEPGCTFVPTPYTDKFSIVERYGKEGP